jgi:hypothetical protein
VNFKKSAFLGGLNMQVDPSRVGDDEYALLFNGRSRTGNIVPVRKPGLCPDCPGGKYQGIYAANQFALLIAGGKAYIKNYEVPGSAFNQVVGLQLDPNVDVIYAETIPASTNNFARVPVSDNREEGVNLRRQIDQTPAAVLLQDGINQPWIVLADGTGRITKTYEQWTLDDPEYVPVGKQMLHDNGILYIASPDGTLIYRSVTDRPLNFMVIVTTPDGDKQATEADGGAANVAHAISVDRLTCLAGLNTPDNAFFAATRKLGAMVVPDFTNTLFDEPRFDNIDAFGVGPVNQFSFVERNGDYVFVSTKGIRSFNATLNMKRESRNVPFSRKLQRLILGITQTNPALGKFDDYILCSLKTVYGDAVVVYDETTEQWVSIDQYENVARVKQFATVVTAAQETLLFITEDNKLYEFEAGAGAERASLYIGDFAPETPEKNQKPALLYVALEGATVAGTLMVTPYVDGKRQANQIVSEPITSNRAPDAVPLTVPFGDDTKTNVQAIPFDLGRVAQGQKVGFLLEWDGDAELRGVMLLSEDEAPRSGVKAEISRWARLNGVAQ